jgi:hypothetical protein
MKSPGNTTLGFSFVNGADATGSRRKTFACNEVVQTECVSPTYYRHLDEMRSCSFATKLIRELGQLAASLMP